MLPVPVRALVILVLDLSFSFYFFFFDFNLTNSYLSSLHTLQLHITPTASFSTYFTTTLRTAPGHFQSSTMAEASKSGAPSYSTDPALYLYTSLTAGSSHIVTATSRLETILRANRVPFKAIDLSVDDKARMLWGRRAGKDDNGRVRKLPGLVQMGLVLGVSRRRYDDHMAI